ncbi:hypothetical protein VPH35_008596 [Triticum aestivum]
MPFIPPPDGMAHLQHFPLGALPPMVPGAVVAPSSFPLPCLQIQIKTRTIYSARYACTEFIILYIDRAWKNQKVVDQQDGKRKTRTKLKFVDVHVCIYQDSVLCRNVPEICFTQRDQTIRNTSRIVDAFFIFLLIKRNLHLPRIPPTSMYA